MRRLAFLALSFSLLGSAVAWKGQDDPKAEDTFRNIQSFKGAKASEIIPAMEFMNASLNVTCDFCHAPDRSSDEKRAKVTTRMMIAMQRDINEKNFRGRNQVTCATCHNGHEHPSAAPPVTGMTRRPHPSPSVVPDQVMAAFAKATAGDPVRPFDQGIRFTGTQMSHGEKAPIEETYEGGKFALVVKTPKGEMRSGFNGKMVWYQTPQGVHQIPLAYAAQRVNGLTIFTGPASLPKLDQLAGGTATIDGHDDLVVTGVMEDKTRMGLFFDKASGLLVRTTFTYPTILGNIVQINDYSNFRKVDGVMIPMTVTRHEPGEDTTVEFRGVRTQGHLDSAEFNPPK